jgi:BarA-like signal transduction histidine kinase
MTAFEEKYNEMVELTSMVVVAMTSEQQAEFERLKSFAGKIN